MKNGDVVFFKKAKGSAHRKAPEAMFKGHGFGILLGHVPLHAPNPPAGFVIAQIGAIGYLSFDDVIEFLGEEAGATCVKKFEEKYIPKPDPNAPKQEELPLDGDAHAEVEQPEPSKLVDMTGKPLRSANPFTAVPSGICPSCRESCWRWDSVRLGYACTSCGALSTAEAEKGASLVSH